MHRRINQCQWSDNVVSNPDEKIGLVPELLVKPIVVPLLKALIGSEVYLVVYLVGV